MSLIKSETDKIRALQFQYESVKSDLDKQVKRSKTLVNPLQVYLGGYQKVATEKERSIHELHKQISEARMELSVFRVLREKELKSIPQRIELLKKEVDNQRAEESLLQTRFANLVRRKNELLQEQQPEQQPEQRQQQEQQPEQRQQQEEQQPEQRQQQEEQQQEQPGQQQPEQKQQEEQQQEKPEQQNLQQPEQQLDQQEEQRREQEQRERQEQEKREQEQQEGRKEVEEEIQHKPMEIEPMVTDQQQEKQEPKNEDQVSDGVMVDEQ